MNRPAPWRSIMTAVVDREPFKVGEATVDPVSRDACWRGGKERLQPQTLKVLMALVSRRGEVVTRDELVRLCWDGRIVGDDVINRCILLLRRFADESGGFRIETVPRAGYRLVEVTAPKQRSRRLLLLAASAAGLIGLGATAFFVRSGNQSAPEEPLTIALLPFSANSDDAAVRNLASAARAAVANTLAQGAYKISTVDTVPQSASPSADFLISGQLTETREKFVATVRMEETAHHVVVFSHQFETYRAKAEDFPQIIGAQVASQLSWTAPLIAIERRHPSDPAITTSLLEASAAGLAGGGNLHDYEESRPVAEKDPNSPLAQINFAFNAAFALDEIPRDERDDAVVAARRAAERALSLAPEFGDTYVPWCLLHSEQRRLECEHRLRTGIRADPDSPFGNWFLASLILNPVGRDAEALESARAALAHDPYMPTKIGLMLQMLEATGQNGAAEDLYRRSVRWWPHDGLINGFRATGIVERGDFEALEQFADEAKVSPRPDEILLTINGKSLPAVRRVCSTAKDFDATVCMLALAQLGDVDSAFAFANRLYPSRRGRTPGQEDQIWMDNPRPLETAFLTGPAGKSMRADPRFLPLADKLGLLEYWRSGRMPDFCTKAHEPICELLSAAELSRSDNSRRRGEAHSPLRPS